MRNIGFTQKAFSDYYTWSLRNKNIFLKITDMITEISRTPFHGTGKPEPLKHQNKGLWSRRITQKDRIVYMVTDAQIIIISCEGHYT